ncbi:alpha/beta hydrolase [Tundrisphaera sp. TA3]|uniref:alpha/beta hydrolase n=1 Tax=Tundrisphaera sp. TA3 TaxID=3435775 RepID=UPI003EB7E6A0
MMRIRVRRPGRLAYAMLLVGAAMARAGEMPAVEGPMPLWPDGPPGVAKDDKRTLPTLTLYRPDPDKATGAAIVICPGGGYGGLADHEGKPIAEWARGLGLTAVVLKYRLGPAFRHPAMLEDAARAIRTVRSHAEDWKIDPKRVAVLGFSAGGHLASTIATHFDAGRPDSPDPVERLSSRPDRAILVYPVIAMATPYGHAGSKKNLLGDNPPADLVASLSNELQVTRDTPPTFMAHTDQDTAVPPENALLFALALRKARVPLELHIFEQGRHGLGLGPKEMPFSEWPGLCARWLDAQGFLKPAK